MTSDRPASRWTHSGDTPSGVLDLVFSWPHLYRIMSLAICKLYMHTARVKRTLNHVKNPAQAERVFSALAEVAKCNASPTDLLGQRFLVCSSIDLVFRR